MPNWSPLWTFASRLLYSGRSDKNKIRARPEHRGNAAAGTGCENNVVVAGRAETVDYRGQGLGLGDCQVSQKPVNIGLAAVALRDERDLCVLACEVPTERSR